jgi:hypothetical protein
VVSKMAFYYEKIRNTVDDKEESLHLKCYWKSNSSLDFYWQNKEGQTIAKTLMHELIGPDIYQITKFQSLKLRKLVCVDRYIILRKACLIAIEGNVEFKEKFDLSIWVPWRLEIEERLRRKNWPGNRD